VTVGSRTARARPRRRRPPRRRLVRLPVDVVDAAEIPSERLCRRVECSQPGREFVEASLGVVELGVERRGVGDVGEFRLAVGHRPLDRRHAASQVVGHNARWPRLAI
jgi:hypothetical protein